MSRHSGAPYGPPSAGEISVPNPITASLHPTLYRVALALAAVAAPAAAQAQTTFTETPITVNGHQNVRASWINRHDAVVATVFDHANEPVAGAVLQGTTVTYVKPPYTGSGPAQPQQIDDSGNVLGFAQYIPLNIPQMFLLRAGVADPNYDIALIEPFGTQGLTQPNPIGIGGGRVIFYTRIISLSAPTDPSYGIPPNPLHYTPEYSQFQTILSVNAHGIVAGRSYGLNGQGEVFFGRGSDFTQIAPAGALSSSGGYINAAGAVAGSYVDSAGAPHGFVYANGAYTSFDMPTRALSIKVTGFSDTGRVVGSYASYNTGVQHVFRYNGAVTSAFGSEPGYDNILVALNSGNKMVVALQDGGGAWHSEVVTCNGAGC
jgi:hypothetical protein